MKLDIKIYGTHQRDFLIEPLRKSLNLSTNNIIYDDRINGGLVMYTFAKAFEFPIANGITHRLCIPDDMIVCNNFIEIVNHMIMAQPDKIICLFSYSFHEHEDLYKPISSPYIKNNGIIPGNGIIMPIKFIKPFFTWVRNLDRDFDSVREEWALYWWAKQNNVEIINTIPSTVQHIGDDYNTTLPYSIGNKNRKTSFFVEQMPRDINWDCKDVLPYPNYEYDFIKRVKQDIARGKGKFLNEKLKPREVLNG